MAQVKSTDDVPPADRAEYWRTVICAGLAPHEVTVAEGTPFSGRMTSANVGLLLVRSAQGTAARVERTPALIRRCDPELVYLLAQAEGQSEVSLHDGRELALKPGDLMLGDTSRPSSLNVTITSTIHRLVVPRQLLPLSHGDLTSVVGALIPSGSGPAAVLGALISELVSHLGDPDLCDNVSASVAIVDMLTAVVAARLECNQSLATQTRHSAMLVQIKVFIEMHLADRELTPALIAAAHHISLRQLQKLFAAENDTVTGRIRRRRMERCRADLVDRNCGQHSAAMIGARWGYPNAAAFSRAFAACYGMPPLAYRVAHRPDDDGNGT